jgi:hypothetical protein
MAISKIQQALIYVDKGMNPHAAAEKAGVQAGSVYRKLKQIREKQAGRCSCCGAPVDQVGKYIPRTGD